MKIDKSRFIAGLLSALILLLSTGTKAQPYTLVLHKNDGMGTSGSLRCASKSHCLHLIKQLEYRRIKGACRLIQVLKNGRVVYIKHYTD